jgi:hypothetical protein
MRILRPALLALALSGLALWAAPGPEGDAARLAACAAPGRAVAAAMKAYCARAEPVPGAEATLERAVLRLLGAGLAERAEFEGVALAFCPLPGAVGMAPAPDAIFLDPALLDRPREIAAILAHELEHIRQFRRMQEGAFECSYARHFIACDGCQDEGHPLEAEADAAEARARRALR